MLGECGNGRNVKRGEREEGVQSRTGTQGSEFEGERLGVVRIRLEDFDRTFRPSQKRILPWVSREEGDMMAFRQEAGDRQPTRTGCVAFDEGVVQPVALHDAITRVCCALILTHCIAVST